MMCALGGSQLHTRKNPKFLSRAAAEAPDGIHWHRNYKKLLTFGPCAPTRRPSAASFFASVPRHPLSPRVVNVCEFSVPPRGGMPRLLYHGPITIRGRQSMTSQRGVCPSHHGAIVSSRPCDYNLSHGRDATGCASRFVTLPNIAHHSMPFYILVTCDHLQNDEAVIEITYALCVNT